MNKIGLYVHIPFCRSICPYCDFHKAIKGDEEKKAYIDLLDFKEYSHQYIPDTIYIGGGTPSCLPLLEINKLFSKIKDNFEIEDNAEITFECNPFDVSEEMVKTLYNNGVNRISLGIQSAVDIERKILGRRSNKEDIKACINTIKENGINNISVDIMLGIPGQTRASLNETLEFVESLDIQHISAYILKLEENTYFYKHQDKFDLLSDEVIADLYLYCIEKTKNAGFHQYEISNFSKPGFQSRHNLKYWNGEDYLGIGETAYSFIDKKRFHYDEKMKLIDDGSGGDFFEISMLNLRLTEGIKNPPPFMRKNAESLTSFVTSDSDGIRLTPKGFLMSNEIIIRLLNEK